MPANQYRDHLISIIHCLLCHLTFLLTYQSLLVHAKQATYMTIFIPLMSHLPFVKYACFIWCHDIYPTTWKSFHKFYLHCCFLLELNCFHDILAQQYTIWPSLEHNVEYHQVCFLLEPWYTCHYTDLKRMQYTQLPVQHLENLLDL
jgi:hypothetical protein